MSGPAEIWLDARVVGSMKTGPDADAGGQQLRYISEDRVGEMIRQASGGDEFFIQILLDEGALIGLTNYGRIFHHEGDAAAWFEIPGPEIEP